MVHPFRTPSPADIWHAKTEAQLVALNRENAQYDESVYPATFDGGREYVNPWNNHYFDIEDH
jgi:hypothetical protein